MTSAKERRHLARVARVPCVLCVHMGLGETQSHVHHMKFGTGVSDRSSHWTVIALCPNHHLGPDGVHMLKEKGLRLRYNLSEIDLLAMTLEALEK